MRGKLLAGFASVALLAAGCGQDAAGPGKVENPGGPLPVSQAELGDVITQQLTCLYQQGLLPNEASSIGKWNDIKAKFAAGDLQGALDATANLVRFIELKFSQYTGPDTINCGLPPVPPSDPDGNVSVEDLKNDVIKNLWAYLGLTGEICQIPAGETGICKTEDQTSGFVYVPPGPQLAVIGLEENPPGLTQLQDLFDEYPNRVRIVSSVTDFSQYPLKPLVVVCFNDQLLPNDQSLIARLLLATRHVDADGHEDFHFIQKPDYSDYPGALEAAQAMCDQPPPAPPPSAFSSNTALGRLANRLFGLLLPKALQARQGEGPPFGGVGGSAEQFSDFGVVDPGFASIGGSAEQFAPQASSSSGGGLANATFDGSSVVGKAGETESDAADLPSVKVVSPATGDGIPGVLVTFALLEPTSHSPSSSATLCDGQTTATTGLNGVATLPCLHFGTTLGYKNLQATFNPTGLDPLACVFRGVLDSEGRFVGGPCEHETTAVNFLVQTTPGDATYIMTYMPPATPPTTPPYPQSYPYPGTPPAFVDVNPSPQAIVTDAYYNGVPGVQIVWTPNTINGSTVNGGATTATTTSGPGGLSSVTWNLGDGSNLLSADISGAVPGAVPAQFTANTPTGVSGFFCALGASKTDLGFLSIKRPTNTIRTIKLWMSVTGQSNFLSAYDVTVTVHTGIPTTTNKFGEAHGLVQLPGNNGNPTPASFTLTDLVFPTETNGTQTLWIKFAFKDQPPNNLPPTRKIQVWYQNTTFKSNQVCYDSKVYAPGSTTSFKRGLSINVTN